MSKPCPNCGRDALGDIVLVHETNEEWHRHCVYDMAFEMRDRALTAEAEVRALREAQGELLGLLNDPRAWTPVATPGIAPYPHGRYPRSTWGDA